MQKIESILYLPWDIMEIIFKKLEPLELIDLLHFIKAIPKFKKLKSLTFKKRDNYEYDINIFRRIKKLAGNQVRYQF